MARYPASSVAASLQVGVWAENIVAQWFLGQGWDVLHRRWHCRWGELDLIALAPNSVVLAFVEVKARRSQNWDAGGLLAITPQKQAKLRQTADLFLADRPQFAAVPCRFDVALVTCVLLPSSPQAVSVESGLPNEIQVGRSLTWNGYRFCLQHYLEAAFE